ncbi:MAG: M13 family metallopeptidase [Proteobacteria bacterium]|nr:M13 family metallopeptidase [Pseudomonadota bacterium]
MKKTAIAIAAVAGLACVAVAATPKATIPPWGFDLTGMDRSVKPGDDFFEYANGAWYKRTEIPADRTSIGSFQELNILSEKRMKDIVAGIEARDRPTLTPEETQIRDLNDAFMDQKSIDTDGLKPAKTDLDRISAVKTLDDVVALMADPSLQLASIAYDGIRPDPKNSDVYVVTMTQGGLGMPNRDYYLNADNADLAKARDAYKAYLAQMLSFVDPKDAAARAAAVYDLEATLAKAHWDSAARRDADKTYNPMTVAELSTFAPGFNWTLFFKTQGLGPDRKVVVRENTAFPAMAETFAKTPVAVWRDYLTIHYLHTMADYLPKAIDDADFDFYGKVIGGQSEQLPRETRAVQLIDNVLPHPFGKLYAAKYFPPASKKKAEKLVANIIAAYDADIHKISWMSDATKKKALDKLHAFTPHIGYPDVWRDYSGLVIKKDDLIGDIERSNAFEWKYNLDRIDQKVDRNEWFMTPSTVNAYYTQSFNSIFFPAAILQPPFFDPNADDAVNYGGIGVVIGHEIGHGFDDQGSKYDGQGILQSWWTADDRKAFEARTTMLGDQFDQFEPLPGMHVNGKLTMGENIGDLSGVTISLKAYHASLHGKKAPVLGGFTGDQRFFLGFAQVWRGKYTDAAMRLQLISNPHSPPHYRVLGPIRNSDAWYRAFHVKPGDKMYLPPDMRVHLW